VRSNLLVVGDEEHGHALLLATLLSAAVRRSPGDVSFVIAEFARPSSSYHRFFDPVRDLPHSTRLVGGSGALAALKDLSADLDARLADAGPSPQPRRFFMVAGLHRWQQRWGNGGRREPARAGERRHTRRVLRPDQLHTRQDVERRDGGGHRHPEVPPEGIPGAKT
jgi:hypothetical protein